MLWRLPCRLGKASIFSKKTFKKRRAQSFYKVSVEATKVSWSLQHLLDSNQLLDCWGQHPVPSDARVQKLSRKLPMAKPWCSTKISAISWISVNWFWILSGLVIGTKSRNSAWACSVCRYSVNWSLTLLNSNWSKIFVFIAPIITHLTIGGWRWEMLEIVL